MIDDLAMLTEPPEVIHGQHLFDAAAASLHFPQTPAVYTCHGWEPYLEEPLVLASVRRFVAVSELTRERLITSGAAPARTTVIPNFVDFERFSRRRDASATARRALVYGNGWRPDAPAFVAIREVCLRRGLELECAGYGFGRPTDRPQDLLPDFDIVFAVGRSALEAMACGCAVVLAGHQGLGGLVTRESFHRQRAANFALALLLGHPVTAGRVDAELDCYDAVEAAHVADLVHAEAGVDAAVERWEEQYRLAIAEGPAPLAEVVADASAYLVRLKALTFHCEQDYGRLAAEVRDWQAQAAGWQAAAAEGKAQAALLQEAADAERERRHVERVASADGLSNPAATLSERDALQARLVVVETHNSALAAWASELHAKLARLETPYPKRIGRKIRDAFKGIRAAWRRA